eukprot:gene15572-biopygen9722
MRIPPRFFRRHADGRPNLTPAGGARVELQQESSQRCGRSTVVTFVDQTRTGRGPQDGICRRLWVGGCTQHSQPPPPCGAHVVWITLPLGATSIFLLETFLRRSLPSTGLELAIDMYRKVPEDTGFHLHSLVNTLVPGVWTKARCAIKISQIPPPPPHSNQQAPERQATDADRTRAGRGQCRLS